jgi:hypothetical protein
MSREPLRGAAAAPGPWGAPATLRAALLALLTLAWLVLGAWIFRNPQVGTVIQYDFAVFHRAGRLLLAGGDPYAPEFAAWMTGSPLREAYAYPPASAWVLLPFLPFPVAVAATLWLSLSIACLVAAAPLAARQPQGWIWLAPLLFYPSLYALLILQWAPVQIGLLALSLWLLHKERPFWAGFVLPLVAIKPTTGIALLLLALTLSWRERRWWLGGVAGTALWYGSTFLLMPDWPARMARSIEVYASPGARQHLVTLASLPDGLALALIAGAIAAWQLWRRNPLGVGCALLVLAMLLTPHRAHYDYPLFCLPLIFLPRRHWWLAASAVAVSWLFPLTYALGWANSLQLTLLTIAPALAACALVERAAPASGSAQPSAATVEGNPS